MNGRDICKEMKKFRERLANEHGIPGFEYKECDFEGDCQGFCPACDAEAKKLFELLKEKDPINKVNVSDLEKVEIPKDVLAGKIVEPLVVGEIGFEGPEERYKKRVKSDKTDVLDSRLKEPSLVHSSESKLPEEEPIEFVTMGVVIPDEVSKYDDPTKTVNKVRNNFKISRRGKLNISDKESKDVIIDKNFNRKGLLKKLKEDEDKSGS